MLGVVCARLGSTRLPGKAMLVLPNGESMVEKALWVIEEARLINKAILCTPDEMLANAVGLFDSVVWAGERNLTGELRCAAEMFRADHVVRITADCPFLTPEIIDHVVNEHLKSGADYTYNHHDFLPSGTKEGIDVEVVTRAGLQELSSKENLYDGEVIKIHRVDMEEERDVFSVNTLADYIKAYKLL